MDRDALVALCEKRFRDTANSIVGESSASGLIAWVDYLEGALTQVNTTTPLWPWLETTSTTTITVLASARSGSLPTDVVQVDSVARVACAADLLRNPGYAVGVCARILGFASAGHLAGTSRRIAGVAARELGRVGPRGVLQRFLRGRTRSRI